jgi:RND family efflux transporter MFP subunit
MMQKMMIIGLLSLYVMVPGAALAGLDGSGVNGVGGEGLSTVARQGETTLGDRYEGVVGPSQSVVLIAPLDSAILKINVEQQSRVAEDDVLVQLDDKRQQLTVARAKLNALRASGIAIAQTVLDEATIDYDRSVALFKQLAIEKWELGKIEAVKKRRGYELQAARDDQEFAKAELALAQEQLNLYKLKAPFSGTIMKVAVEQGAFVARNDQIMLLVNLDKLEAEMPLPIELYGKLKVGKDYRIAAGKPVNRVVVGKLKSFEPARDAASDTFRVTFEIENAYEAKKSPAQMPQGFSAHLVWPQ